MQRFLKTITTISNIIITIIFLGFAAYLILPVFGLKGYTVPTGSMEPNIHAGSLVVVDNEVEYDEIKVGDIIVYERPSDKLLIIHRVIDINDNGFLPKGDANMVSDGIRVTPDIFVGRCELDIPYLGTALDAITTTTGKVIYCCFVIGSCALELIANRMAIKKLKGEKNR